MSTSLARKIRRIGLVRLAQTKIVATQDEQGNECEGTYTTYTTYRTYRPFISEAELSAKTEEIVTAWRAKRKKNRRAA